ncbi:MAG TPA: hypothetical protein VMC10_11315 [Stellaceae bacterium]|nr:hypothetical protein [Stellaceae bacterium]
MKRVRLGVVIGIAVLLLAGCDSGGDPGSPASRSGIDQDINATSGSDALIGSRISPSFSDSRFSDRYTYGGGR